MRGFMRYRSASSSVRLVEGARRRIGHVGQRLGRNSMVHPDDPHTDPIEKWIVIAAIVLLILAGLGVDMLIRHDVSAAVR
jgi:hypothetical protein